MSVPWDLSELEMSCCCVYHFIIVLIKSFPVVLHEIIMFPGSLHIPAEDNTHVRKENTGFMFDKPFWRSVSLVHHNSHINCINIISSVTVQCGTSNIIFVSCSVFALIYQGISYT